MKSKQITILAIILVILTVGIFARNKTQQTESQANQTTYATIDSNPESVTNISIDNSSGSLKFSKESDSWKNSDGYQIDSSLIQTLLSESFTPERSQLVSETDRRHEELAVTSASPSARLVFSDDNQLLTLLIGESTQDGRYIRVNEDPEVYLVKNFPSIADSTDINSWLDKKIASFNEADIAKINIDSQTSSIELEQKDNQWLETQTSQSLADDVVRPLLNELDSLIVNRIATKAEVAKTDTATALLALEITRQNESKALIEAYPNSEDEYLVTVSGTFGEYIISQLTFNNLNLTQEELAGAAEE